MFIVIDKQGKLLILSKQELELSLNMLKMVYRGKALFIFPIFLCSCDCLATCFPIFSYIFSTSDVISDVLLLSKLRNFGSGSIPSRSALHSEALIGSETSHDLRSRFAPNPLLICSRKWIASKSGP